MSSDTRKLTVIMFTDMVGYSKQFSTNEERAMMLLEEHNQILDRQIEAFGGSVIKTAGDSYMVDFDSVISAVNSAVEIQRDLDKRNTDTDADGDRIEVRIGIHVGDVFYRGADVFGDGVNVASRVMSQANDRQVYVTRDVMSIAYGKLELLYKDRGMFDLKNIDRPIHVYEVLWDPARAQEATKDIHLGAAPVKKGQNWIGIAAAAIIALAVGSFVFESGPDEHDGSRLKLAVIEFDADTDDERLNRVQINKILTDAIVTKFSEFKPVQIISPRRIAQRRSEVQTAGLSTIDGDVAQQIATGVGGRLVIGGKLTQLGDEFILSATLWDLSRENDVLSKFQASVTSPEVLLSTMVDSLSLRFQRKLVDIYELDVAEVHNVVGIGELTTHSLDAYGLMVKGYDLYSSGFIDAGVQEIVKATEIDTNFAIAYSMIACAYSFAKEDSLSSLYASKARIYKDRFTGISVETLIFRGNEAWFDYYGAQTEAEKIAAMKQCERSYRTITELYPDAYQGYLYLGLYHGYLSGDHETAIELYKKAAELNPQWFPTYRDLAYSTKAVKGQEDAIRLLEVFVSEYPEAPGVPYARQTIKELGG
jgi:class 3 adenylate cyclase/tetratricopeptide (TPR) repeat protein